MVDKYTKGRPEKLNGDRKHDISKVFDIHQDWKIKKIYKEVIGPWKDTIQKEMRKQYPKITQNQLEMQYDEELPGYDTVRNYINNELKPNMEKQKNNPLDKPWDIGTLADHDLPAEALSTVLVIWSMSQQPPEKPLTIREAKWVSRLYRVVGNLDFLYEYARFYAGEELWEKRTGELHRPGSSFGGDIHRLAVTQAIQQLRHGGVYTLEEIARSVYQKPPKGNEVYTDESVQQVIAELMMETAYTAKVARMPAMFQQVPQWARDAYQRMNEDIQEMSKGGQP